VASWTTGVFTVSLTTAVFLGARVRRPGRVVWASLALVGTARDQRGPHWTDLATLSTFAPELLVYLGYSMTTWGVFRAIRGLSEVADSARRHAARLELERSRAQYTTCCRTAAGQLHHPDEGCAGT
jgi:hypothetical protein